MHSLNKTQVCQHLFSNSLESFNGGYSWLFIGLLLMVSLCLNLLVEVPSLSEWSGCKVETCLYVYVFLTKNVLIIGSYAITIICFVLTGKNKILFLIDWLIFTKKFYSKNQIIVMLILVMLIRQANGAVRRNSSRTNEQSLKRRFQYPTIKLFRGNHLTKM